jgi:hypothetical protein
LFKTILIGSPCTLVGLGKRGSVIENSQGVGQSKIVLEAIRAGFDFSQQMGARGFRLFLEDKVEYMITRAAATVQFS